MIINNYKLNEGGTTSIQHKDVLILGTALCFLLFYYV